MVRERDVFEIRMFEIQMFLLMLMYRECVGTSEIVRDREYFDIRVFEISRFYCSQIRWVGTESDGLAYERSVLESSSVQFMFVIY